MNQYATPPRFGTQPVEQASLLTLLEITGTCRCGATFTTTDPDRRLCDLHLVECINGAGILEDDDEIDWDRPTRTPPAMTRITCAACGTAASIPVTASGRLCDLCREDLGATARRLQANIDQINATWRAALERWDADYAHACEADQARYQAVVEARGKVHEGLIKEASYMGRYREAIERNDGLTALLQAEHRRDEASELASKLLAECERGLAEVEATRV
jgi:hypothetical protein